MRVYSGSAKGTMDFLGQLVEFILGLGGRNAAQSGKK